ncbi:MAG: HD domain-containing protein [Chitinophagales bacterium]|nr:HD domain-containing protein [Chitinophagales bacterium]MDW8418205.1 HD domain-containing protein [Chitinophagales bacterium]
MPIALNLVTSPRMNKRKIFNDPVHGFITIPHELIFDVIEHPYFQRLRRIKQLGLTDYVYPGAIHTRFHHALGAFHLMRKAISILKIKGVKISPDEELAACIAILLHDIGHGPFSHALEHTLLQGVRHEDISRVYIHRLNEHFKGKLRLAIEIFEGRYRKKFLHQLVSSQLDVDRLDYLTRDSFFTGVNEGSIATERIIEMMNVHNDEIVIDQKGIYSIESFIVSRRLMYWQVYLHKTVLCVEMMLVKALERAKELMRRGEKLGGSPALLYFLQNKVRLKDFTKNPALLEYHAQLDDVDVISGLKHWLNAPDKILRMLCQAVLHRKLFKIEISNRAFSYAKIRKLNQAAMKKYQITEAESAYLVFSDATVNHAYNPNENRINILMNNGEVIDIALASDQLNISVLSVPVTKYYVFYPKRLV